MDFFRKLSKRSPPQQSDEDEQRLQSLYDIVRDHGDAILLGQTKLSLTTPILIFLNGAFQKLTEGINQPCFQVANISDETKKVQFPQFTRFTSFLIRKYYLENHAMVRNHLTI